MHSTSLTEVTPAPVTVPLAPGKTKNSALLIFSLLSLQALLPQFKILCLNQTHLLITCQQLNTSSNQKVASRLWSIRAVVMTKKACSHPPSLLGVVLYILLFYLLLLYPSFKMQEIPIQFSVPVYTQWYVIKWV